MMRGSPGLSKLKNQAGFIFKMFYSVINQQDFSLLHCNSEFSLIRLYYFFLLFKFYTVRQYNHIFIID